MSVLPNIEIMIIPEEIGRFENKNEFINKLSRNQSQSFVNFVLLPEKRYSGCWGNKELRLFSWISKVKLP